MKNKILILFLVLATGFQFSCEPERAIYDDEVLITLATTSGDYFVQEENNTYTLPVWLLRPANEDISVTLTVDEEASTAVEGEDFTIVEQTVVIPAGELTADFVISADFAEASPDGEMVKFNLTSDDADLTEFRNTFELNIQKSCPFESLAPSYTATVDAFGGFVAPSFQVTLNEEGELEFSAANLWGPNFVAWATGDPSYAGLYPYPGTITLDEDNNVVVTSEAQYMMGGEGIYDGCSGTFRFTIETSLFGGVQPVNVVLTPNEDDGTTGEGEGTDGEETGGEGTDGEGGSDE